jgi:copper chaperone CopZ
MAKKEYRVEGMNCQHCVMHVKNALEKLDGVEKVFISLEDSLVSIFAENQPDLIRINKALDDAGHYKISET